MSVGLNSGQYIGWTQKIFMSVGLKSGQYIGWTQKIFMSVGLKSGQYSYISIHALLEPLTKEGTKELIYLIIMIYGDNSCCAW